jgi:chemotaxis receptor (MCP) glutamine deamidase CheD
MDVNNFAKELSDYVSERFRLACNSDDKYKVLTLSNNGKIVTKIYYLFDRDVIYIDIYRRNFAPVDPADNLAKAIEAYLRKNSEKYANFIYRLNKRADMYCFSVYLVDPKYLQIQAQPVNETVLVIPGEYAITHANDPNPILATFGIDNRFGILLWDPAKKAGAIAHIDFRDEILNTLEKMIEELYSLGCERYFLHITPNIGTDIKYYMDNIIITPNTNMIKTMSGIIKNYGIMQDIFMDLTSNFSFDTRTYEINYRYKPIDYQINDPTLPIRRERVDYRIKKDIRLCFPAYLPHQ